ncbi:hypothetical protein V492_07101 [Pseudogymnoascus sp. VKM F-4246]|nr:hypothetical protein V492_07101 [Pseudogymnoascus sp. VKM F-4246]
MKRKLDGNDVPAPVVEETKAPESNSFADLGLDARLLQAIAKQNFKAPTLVQKKAIPLAIKGRDILARAKTGSGKTAAYLLPILHAILKQKETSTKPCTAALILVPTRELADQVFKAVELFTSFCAKDVRAINLTQKVSDAVQRSLLADAPDIVVATPARAALNINTSALSLDSLTHLVIDEADLVLSYGYDEDLQNVAKTMRKGVQTILMSATLTSEVDTLKGLFCRDPAVLKLDEQSDEGEEISQYVVKCAEDEKFLLIYVIFKLKLIKGKCIVFVQDIDRCYRLKLFLEQFGIKSCILNSELPVNSRIHVVEEFNKNVYDIIIASDEYEIIGDEEDAPRVQEIEEATPEVPKKAAGDDEMDVDAAEGEEVVKEEKPAKKKRKQAKRDKEYGVSRGIDFKNVACVLNFDLPTTSKSYTHRVGRTGRAGQSGMALSFVIPADQYRKHKPTSVESCKHDEEVLAKIIRHQTKKGKEVKPYNFDMKQVEAFRYRMGDALRAVTRIAVREARTRELRQELMKSDKLKRHFEENPEDLHHLRHDGELRAAKVQGHMKHVPSYLMPSGGQKAITGDLGFVGIRKESENRIRKARAANKAKGRGAFGSHAKKHDPLKSFRARTKNGK